MRGVRLRIFLQSQKEKETENLFAKVCLYPKTEELREIVPQCAQVLGLAILTLEKARRRPSGTGE